MDTLNITRHSADAAEALPEISGDFLESRSDNPVAAVYTLHPTHASRPIGFVTLYITEYADGTFWTIAEREDCLGSFSACIDFLLKYFGYDK